VVSKPRGALRRGEPTGTVGFEVRLVEPKRARQFFVIDRKVDILRGHVRIITRGIKRPGK
jgi:hypothetical protein